MTFAANLPFHVYGFVDRSHLTAGERSGWEPAVWYGVTLPRNRAIGLSVLLENGAMYRELPSHSWSFTDPGFAPWGIADAEAWDCFGGDAQLIEYTYLRDMTARVFRAGTVGTYLFTLEWSNNGYSRYPGQSKCLHAIHLENGMLTWQPNDRLMWKDASFTSDGQLPVWLRRNSEVWHSEE